MKKVLPYDASCEDIDFKQDLNFLDGFVRRKLDEGAKPYQDPSLRVRDTPGVVPELETKKINFTPYAEPKKPTAMKVGGTRIIIIPSKLAYGAKGVGCKEQDEDGGEDCKIPPYATVEFTIQLVKIERRA